MCKDLKGVVSSFSCVLFWFSSSFKETILPGKFQHLEENISILREPKEGKGEILINLK